MRIRATLRCMAASEIMRMISDEKLAEIKAKDKSPMFKAFVVGHEGEARGNLIGVGNVIKRWFRGMIEKLHEKINIGLQLFHGHAATNDASGRVPIGEVVGKALLNIKNRASTVVACYVRPEFKNLPLDVASIEADVELEQDRRGVNVVDVGNVTAIALGNSAIETPGFPGATLLGQLQAFAKDKKVQQEDYMDITIEDVRSFLKAEKTKPSDLFGAEDLTEDPTVKGFVETEKRRAVAGEYAHRKRTEEGFDTTKKELEDRLKERDEKIRTLQIDAAKAQVGTLFEKQKGERKLDERQVKFVQSRLAKFTPTKIEDLEKEFNLHLDAEVDEYKRIAKDVFGVEDKSADDKIQNGGTGPDDKTKSLGPESKYLDPAQNPLIRTVGTV